MKNKGRLLFGGILAVPIAFSISILFESLWVGYFAAFITATIWLIVLDRSIVSKSQNKSSKTLIRTFIGLLVITQLYASIQYYEQSERHGDNLNNIRTTIVSSISHLEMEKALQRTLRYYYLETDQTELTLEDSFRELFEDRMADNNTFLHETPNDSEDMHFTYEIASPDSIILSVSATFTHGTDVVFENRSGQTGMYEARTTLTKNGVEYERQN
ncbi:MAG: hypothetical protein WD381_00195 [Balneolaceae bacterium]